MTPAGQSVTPQINILLLGSPLVSRNGQLVHINRRELRAGLYYLAGHTEPVSRAEICYIFWPDDSEEVSRKKLREGLSRLRSAFQDPDFIVSNNDFISLNTDHVYVDAREFTNLVTPLLNSAEMNGNGILPEWIHVQLRKAIELCRGHQFLQEAPLLNSPGFDAWVSLNDQTFAFSYEKILERLAEHSIALGNIDEAMIWLGKILSYDHMNTDINFLMLNCLCECRKFKEALDYLAFLDTYYQANQPGGLPEVLKEMSKRLQRESQKTKINVHKEWPGEVTNNLPFVGRNDLLLKLDQAYHRKGLVHVTGESGTGKTRLVQEFYSRLESSPRLLFCIGKPMISSAPYIPIIEGLNRLVTEKEWAILPDDIKTGLHSLYPDLQFSEKRLSPIIIEKLPENPSLRIHTALYSLLKFLAEKKTLMMVIDIAQWCDDATLQFLGFLNERQFFKHYGLLILISRAEERNPVLEAYLDQSVLNSNLERMVMQPFTLDETSQLISLEMGKTVSADLVKKIQSQTGGNPYSLIETLRALDPYQIDVSNYSERDHFPIPASIRAVVNQKIRALSDCAREVLLSASILGQQFQPLVLEKMVKIDFEKLLSALEELQQAGILFGKNESQKSSFYEFPHDQVREVVIEELSPARHRGLHLAAVRAMLEVRGEAPDLASTYAWHYEQAGEYVKAFSEWCAAGRYSRNCYSKEDAYASYQRALNLLPDLPEAESSVLLRQLMLEWGDYGYDLFDDQICEKLYKTGLEQGEARQDPLMIGVSMSGLGRVAEMRNEVDEGIELHHRALYFLSKVNGKAETLETYARLGILYELKNDYKKAKETFMTGLDIDYDYSDMRVLDASVNLKTQLSLLNSMMGFPAQAELEADQAANESKLINRLSGRVHAYTALAIAQYYGGKYQKSLQNAFSVFRLAEQVNLEWWVSLLDITIAKNYLIMGKLDEAWQHLNHAITGKEPVHLEKIINYHHVLKGDIFRLLGEYSSAEEQYRQGAQMPSSDLQSLENYFALGLALLQRNEIAEGLKIVKDALERAQTLGLESVSLAGGIMLEAWTKTEIDAEQFIHETAPQVAELKKRGFGTGDLTAKLIAGGIALKRGEPDKAKAYLLEVAETSRSMNHCWNELWAMSALAGIKGLDDNTMQQFINRKNEIMDEMAAHATKLPLTTLMRKFQRSI